MADIHGKCDARFKVLGEILSDSIDAGDDLGASVALTLNGEMLVDLWGGWTDPEKTTPWAENTITNVWSTTKTMTSLCALVLVERGELDVFAPVATYWPEFAANGKEAIEVRHIMSHTSGVSGWAEPITIEDLYDWDKVTSLLAAQEPWWEPGTASGYHMLNFGYLVGEVVRRISGKSLGTFFADEVAGPLGADFHIGLDPAEFHRVSNVVPPPALDIDMAAMDPTGVAMRTFVNPLPSAEVAWTPEWRQAEIGAAGGHGNARSVALIQAVVANGGEVNGVRLLSPETIDLIFHEQSNGIDLVLGEPLRFGIGYGLPNELLADTIGYTPDDKIYFWGGWGGSQIIVDVGRGMTLAYMMNKMGSGLVGSATSAALAKATYEALR